MTTVTPTPSTLNGHRATTLGRSPFAATAPSIIAAIGYAIAAMIWVAAGATLPGGRWLAVHLFTLGVVTNLVLVFSDHFGRTVTRSAAPPVRWQPVVVNAGIPLVLVGITTATTEAVAVGATILTAVVLTSYRRLRRMRKQAVGARFAWIARVYERAHVAFVHGAILGLLMGVGVLGGGWYSAARIAHMHANVLGWGGLTVLATLVFFGPTVVRTRIVPGSDERAAGALRLGASGLMVGVFLLLGTGAGGDVATVLRIAAAAAIGLLAWAATVTCLAVAAAARGAKPTTNRWPVIALSLWFPVAAWADVAVIATGAWRFLEVVGLAALLGVLVQTIAVVLTYVSPMLRSRSFAGRDRLLARFERGATVRALAYNTGVIAVLAATASAGVAGAVLARAGWALIMAAIASLLVAAVAPIRAVAAEAPPVSQVARRYRSDRG